MGKEETPKRCAPPNSMDASEIAVTDTMDRLILNTAGRFIDRCPDQGLLERVKKVLIPIQMGKAEAQPFFVQPAISG